MKSEPLTKRDAWAATFEHVFMSNDSYRTDCPEKLVDPFPIPDPIDLQMKEAELPLSDLQRSIAQIQHQLTAGAPIRKTPHHNTLIKQGELSQWLQDTWHTHVRLHDLQKKGQAAADEQYELDVFASITPLWLFGEHQWRIINASACGHGQRSLIHSRHLKCNSTGSPFCLTHNLSSAATRSVFISPCYPSSDPCSNNNPRQWWSVRGDASIRTLMDESLALSTVDAPTSPTPPHLAKYEGLPTQSWAYNGPAPGMNGGGEIMYGNGVDILGVIDKKVWK